MDAAFAWIGKLAEFLGSFIPRLLIIEATQIGVAFKRGKHVIPLSPGLWPYWPFWTTIDVRAAVRQTEPLPPQPLETKDNKTVVVGGMVRYRIDDPIKALAETYDLDACIVDESLAVFCEFVTARTVEALFNRTEINTALTRRIRSVLTDYGVYVLRAQLTAASRSRTLCLVGVNVTHPVIDDE